MMMQNRNVNTNKSPSAILIIGPAWVGDMVMSQSLYRLLATQHPGVAIDILAPQASGPIVKRMPEIRRFIPMPIGHGQLKLLQRYQLGRMLRKASYDQAIVLPNSFKSALIPWFANIPIRTGWRGEMRYGLLNDLRVLDKKVLPFMVDRFIALGLDQEATLPTETPLPIFDIGSKMKTAIQQRYNLYKTKRPILALCPGAEYGPAKRWPASYFAEVGRHFIEKGWDVWLFGGPKDQAITHDISHQIGKHCYDLGGKTSLLDAVDLLSLANAVISNDSGLMHIAAALKIPLVVIYGSSDPGFTPPLAQDVKIVTLGLECSPCFKRECPLSHLNCLQELKPDRVITALMELDAEIKTRAKQHYDKPTNTATVIPITSKH